MIETKKKVIEVDLLGEEADRRAKAAGAPRYGLWKLSDWSVKHRLGLTIWGICTIWIFGIGTIPITLGIYGYLMNKS